MGRFLLLCPLVLMLLWATPAPAIDADSPEYWELREQLVHDQLAARQTLEDLAAELHSMEPSSPATGQLERYYTAVVDWLYQWQRTAAWGTGVTCILRPGMPVPGAWPGDPLNDWEPLPIQDITDDPLPGGIVFQTCPVDYYSDLFHLGYPTVRSFEVSIYAHPGLVSEPAAPLPDNADWAVARPEMLAMRGCSAPSYELISDAGYDSTRAGENARAEARRRELVADWFREDPSRMDLLKANGLDIMRLSGILTADAELTRLEERWAGIPPEDWDPADLETWLQMAKHMVYAANEAGRGTDGPAAGCGFNLNALVRDGFLPRVPPNPFAGGRPLRVLTPADGFSPGDLCLVLPASYWAGYSGGGVAPVNYHLFVYGPAINEQRAAELEAQLTITNGTYHVPPGACDTTMVYSTSYLLNADYLNVVNCTRPADASAVPLPEGDPMEMTQDELDRFMINADNARILNSAGQSPPPVTTSVRLRDEAAARLREGDPAGWAPEEVDSYLGLALWSCFGAMEIHREVTGTPAPDPRELVAAGYLAGWPLNPFDNWRPVRLLTPADGFSAGDIVLQPDPDGNGGYELGIYGPTPDSELVEWCRPYVGHEEWAEIPPGMRYLTGAPDLTITEVWRQVNWLSPGHSHRIYTGAETEALFGKPDGR